MSISPGGTRIPTSPLPDGEIKWENQARITAGDQGVQKVAQPRFQKLRKACSSCFVSLKGIVISNHTRDLSMFLAAYPIAKITIALITGAAISLPPVALGLLIAATALFLIHTIMDFIANHSSRFGYKVKYALNEMVRFALAPATTAFILTYIITNSIEKGINAIADYRRAPAA